jgi:hypothetical protein
MKKSATKNILSIIGPSLMIITGSMLLEDEIVGGVNWGTVFPVMIIVSGLWMLLITLRSSTKK